MDWYFIANWLHILSSSVLFGTGIGTVFQMVCAMHTKRVETIASVSASVCMADLIFTTPAGLFQPLSGLWLVYLQGYALTEPWLLLTYALYVVAFLAWLHVVVLQLRIRDLAAGALASGGPLPEQVWRDYRIWFALGWPAFTALITVYWLMVSKPPLWS